MGIQSTQTITRKDAEYRLAELLFESELTNEQIKQLITYPTKRSELVEFVVRLMTNRKIEDQIEILEANPFYNYCVED